MSREDLVLDARVEGAPSQYRFRTVDGVHSADAFRTAELLLVDALWDRSPGRLLVPEANYGVVGTVLAHAADAVAMTESSARAADCCRENARRNGATATVDLRAGLATIPGTVSSGADEHGHCGATTETEDGAPGRTGHGGRTDVIVTDGSTPLPATGARRAPPSPLDRPTPRGSVDAVAYAPEPYTPVSVGKQRIADALSALRPGGRCYVAAAPETGGSRYETCLRTLAADVTGVRERDGVELLEATRPQSVDPPAYATPEALAPTVDGVDLDLVSMPGLFAASGLDHGTRLLLETIDVPDGADVLDACCGYGPIGAYAAAVADCEVWLADDDRVATRCAAASLDRTGVDGRVVTADCCDGLPDDRFDRAYCNPPTHAGSGVLSELFTGIRRVLAADGACVLVHHRDLDLSTHLRGFGRIETLATGEEHVVVRATL